MPLDLKQPTLRHHVILLIIIGGMSEIRTHNLSGDKHWLHRTIQGRIQDFKLGGAYLQKIAPSGGMRENFWGISCEKSRFYAKKIIFFPILGGACAGCAPPPPGTAPAIQLPYVYGHDHNSPPPHQDSLCNLMVITAYYNTRGGTAI